MFVSQPAIYNLTIEWCTYYRAELTRTQFENPKMDAFIDAY
jgi:hypothetical protein